MQDYVTLERFIRWLGVCLLSALLTLASIAFAAKDTGFQQSKEFVFHRNDGSASESTQHVDVSIKFDRLIVVNDLQKKELILSASAPGGTLTDSKPYCVAKNYTGKVRLRITGDHHKDKTFQMAHASKGERIPITVKVKDEKAKGAPVEYLYGDEKEITAVSPDGKNPTCSEATTLLIVEAAPHGIPNRSGTYKTKLHLRFVAL